MAARRAELARAVYWRAVRAASEDSTSARWGRLVRAGINLRQAVKDAGGTARPGRASEAARGEEDGPE
jgi:hypothetical protein